MFNTTTIVDKRTTKQEVVNNSEVNIESSGSICKTASETRFININKNQDSFKTIFSSEPFYKEIEQTQDGETDEKLGRHSWKVPYYKNVVTKIKVKVKQVLVVGSDYILEVEEISREDVSEKFLGSQDKNKYFNTPTIL